MKTKIIAEVGVNHNGSMALAFEMIDSAKEAGADIVKFQTYISEELMLEDTPLAEYMTGTKAKNFMEIVKRNELSPKETLKIKEYCEKKDIGFMSSPFDPVSCRFLKDMGVNALKIPSGETVNPFLLSAAAETKLPLIVSTGMCTLDEVKKSINYLKEKNCGPLTILHCTTQYPADLQNLNLNAITTLRDEFNLPVGYSDHSLGINASLAAVALGACVIEKHFTTDKTLPGPDQKASLDPCEMNQLVKGIRELEIALGNGIKEPFNIELEIGKVARKSLVFKRDMKMGDTIEYKDLQAKRPGTGIPAFEFESVVGKKLIKDVPKDCIFTFSCLGQE